MFNPHEIKWDNGNISRLWDYYASNSNYSDFYFNKVHGKRMLAYLMNHVNLYGKTLLDYGSGPGYMLDNLLNFNVNCDYWALDFSDDSIKILKEKYSIYTSIFKGAYHSNEFPFELLENQFDVVIVSEVIEHLDDKNLNDLMKKIYKLLRHDGYVFITTPNEENLNLSLQFCPECGCVYHRWQHIRSWTRDNLISIMSQYGFKLIHSKATILFGPREKFKYWTKRLLGDKINKPNLVYIGRPEK